MNKLTKGIKIGYLLTIGSFCLHMTVLVVNQVVDLISQK